MVANTFKQAVVSVSNPRQLLSAEQLAPLNHRSNALGSLRLLWHLSILTVSGYVWSAASGVLAVAALTVYGASLAFMFCAVHECVHRTAFASNRVNDAIAWLAGILSLYNSAFYRRYHKWHHRYTRVAGKDPELEDLEPRNLGEYLRVLSGLPWWKGKLIGHAKVAMGSLDEYYYLPESAHESVVRSTRLQLGVYGAIAIVSTALGHPWFIVKYWLLPLAVGQPQLRFMLLAEHTGCSYGEDMLTNTRTTLTLGPLRLLAWNMPYHAEHHLYPSISFHALPVAHEQLKAKFSHVDTGYLRVNHSIVDSFQKVASTEA